MDQIKDMVTLRAFALDKAVATFYGMDIDEHLGKRIIDRAKDIEAYILGDAKLPESDNSIEMFKDVLTKINKPTPTFMWQDPEVILPSHDAVVLCALKYGSTIEYVPMFYNSISEEWYGGNDDDNGNHVVAWLPIPQYREEGEI